MVNSLRRGRGRVELRFDDPTQTPDAGLLVGGDFLCDLDSLRADLAGAALSTIACPPAPTTAAGLARRFGPQQLHGIQAGLAAVTARPVELLPAQQGEGLGE